MPPHPKEDIPMKKIGFVTTNKVLAQSLAAAMRNSPQLGFAPFLLLNPRQAALDAEVFSIDIAVVDVIDGSAKEPEAALSLYEQLRGAVVGCRILLLVSQENRAGQEMAIRAMKSGVADDFVFYDTSLEYLFAKIAAF